MLGCLLALIWAIVSLFLVAAAGAQGSSAEQIGPLFQDPEDLRALVAWSVVWFLGVAPYLVVGIRRRRQARSHDAHDINEGEQ